MNALKKIGLIVATLTLGVGILVGTGTVSEPLAKKAHAAVDSWSNHAEQNTSWSGALTAFTPALICTAVTTANPNLKALVITSSASGLVNFHNANSNAGSTQVFAVGLIANTPLVLSEEVFRQGYKFGLGNPIYIDGPTGTVTVDYTIRVDTK